MTEPTSPPPVDPQELRDRFAVRRALLDGSVRGPALWLFAASVFWLVLGSSLGLLAALKMHIPGLLTGQAWLTFGRVRPAHLNAVVYGWGSQAGVAVALWLVVRLTASRLAWPRMAMAGVGLWNVGVAGGVVGILAGESTAIEWLEFPTYAPPFIAAGFLCFAVPAVLTFLRRREPHVYVSLWYVMGALLWLPWLYVAAQFSLVNYPVPGVVQPATNWWFAHNVLGLWLTPIGLGAIYYLIPKVIGRPIYSYHLSILGFWSLALFYSWAGMHHLIGGPMPEWLVTSSVVASVMMFIPVVAVAVNQHLTMVGHFRHVIYSPTLRFIVFGALAYTAVSVQGSLQALRYVNLTTHFTHFTIAHAHLGAYGFFSMVMFGAMYYIVPRLTGWEWASPTLIRVHFWATAAGIIIYFVSLTVGGWSQGGAMDDPSVAFITVVRDTIAYLELRSIGGSLMVLGHLAFAVLFVLNLLKLGRRRYAATLLGGTGDQG